MKFSYFDTIFFLQYLLDFTNIFVKCFFKMDANMAAMHKMAACKKANHQILTQFFPSNMLTTL